MGAGWSIKAGSSLIAALVLMGLLAGLAARGTGVAAAPGKDELPTIGTIYTMGLDDRGTGWAWTAAPNDLSEPHLIRLEGGTWRIVSEGSGATMVAHTQKLDRIAVTSAGDEGWAIGADPTDKPTLWHIKGQEWSQIPLALTSAAYFSDLVLSGDGSDGLIAGDDGNNAILMQLINGTWSNIAGPLDGTVQTLAISPNGDYMWAWGTTDAGALVWQLTGFTWAALPGEIPSTDYADSLAVDDSGAGWLVAPGTDASTNSSLLRLTMTDTTPLSLTLPLLTHSEDSVITLFDLRVDSQGRGWATGSAETNTDPIRGSTFTPLLFRLDGTTVSQVPVTGFQPTVDPTPPAILYPLALSRNGAYSWLGGFRSNTIRFLNLVPLVEPWLHATPAAAGPVPGTGLGQCFAAVPYCLRGVFAKYWAAHGGLDGLGYPLTPEVSEAQGDKTYTVQYTQRARLEYHPEFAGTPNEVLLGLLGNALADPRRAETPFAATTALAAPAYRFFPETGHNLGAPFLKYWTTTGGLSLYGLPRSEAFQEVNAADGKRYQVQYFERNRLEYHPENAGTKFDYLLGLLGVEQFRKSYGYTP